MNTEMILEIHFHQQDEASIYLESNTTGKDEKFGEILLFCLVTLRLMVNLGFNWVSDSLATVLSEVSNTLVKFVEYVQNSSDSPKLVDYKGSPGRKRFIASFRYTENSLKNFKFSAKGFGLLARGVGYYAPNSVMLLLRYLARRRINDENFIYCLSQAAKGCGETYYSGRLSISTQHRLALIISHLATDTLNLENQAQDIWKKLDSL